MSICSPLCVSGTNSSKETRAEIKARKKSVALWYKMEKINKWMHLIQGKQRMVSESECYSRPQLKASVSHPLCAASCRHKTLYFKHWFIQGFSLYKIRLEAKLTVWLQIACPHKIFLIKKLGLFLAKFKSNLLNCLFRNKIELISKTTKMCSCFSKNSWCFFFFFYYGRISFL